MSFQKRLEHDCRHSAAVFCSFRRDMADLSATIDKSHN